MRLTASGINHGFGSHTVLDNVDLEVSQGDSLAIVGPSGSGKTTLLSILGGLVTPRRGTVRVDGAAPARGLLRDHVAWILQTANVLPDRTVVDNVALGALSERITRAQAEDRARQTVATVGLSELHTMPVRLLSGGEVQRVAIARALVGNRPFVMADEPTGQLDARTSARVMDALFKGVRERALVVVTHDVELAAMCQRVLELRDGTVHEVT